MERNQHITHYDPPSPAQPICPWLFPSGSLTSSCRQSAWASRNKGNKPKPPLPRKKWPVEIPEEILVEFYRTHGSDGRGIHHLLGSPYSNGVTAWRLLMDWWKKEGMALMMRIRERERSSWAEKYRPRRLDDFIFHRNEALLLRHQFAQGVDSHFIFEGPPGVGKKTMACAFLREVFGPETLKMRHEAKVFELKGEERPSITVNVTFSPHHVEIDISKLDGYEKYIIEALVEETHIIAKECNRNESRAIVLYRADQLCVDIQHYIRWIMEKHQKCHKFLFCCSDIYNLEQVRSICTVIQLPPPSNDEIVEVLEHIADKEDIEMDPNMAETIANNSENNLRQAIRLFESSPLVRRNSHQTVSV